MDSTQIIFLIKFNKWYSVVITIYVKNLNIMFSNSIKK